MAAVPSNSSPTMPKSTGNESTVSTSNNQSSSKRKRRPAGTPDPDAEVVSLSPKTLMESDRYVCEICNQGFQRDQNLQMHRRRHKVPWKLLKRSTPEVRKRVYVCPETSCLHHDPCHALGDLVGIKKHYRRKHSSDKQWKCDRCSKGYAVQSDYKAHLKTCGTRGHCCACGRVFSRVESFIEHQDACAVAKERSLSSLDERARNPSPSSAAAATASSFPFLALGTAGQPARQILRQVLLQPHHQIACSLSLSNETQYEQQQQQQRELQLLPINSKATGSSSRSTSSSLLSPRTTTSFNGAYVQQGHFESRRPMTTMTTTMMSSGHLLVQQQQQQQHRFDKVAFQARPFTSQRPPVVMSSSSTLSRQQQHSDVADPRLQLSIGLSSSTVEETTNKSTSSSWSGASAATATAAAAASATNAAADLTASSTVGTDLSLSCSRGFEATTASKPREVRLFSQGSSSSSSNSERNLVLDTSNKRPRYHLIPSLPQMPLVWPPAAAEAKDVDQQDGELRLCLSSQDHTRDHTKHDTKSNFGQLGFAEANDGEEHPRPFHQQLMMIRGMCPPVSMMTNLVRPAACSHTTTTSSSSGGCGGQVVDSAW